MNQLKSLFVFAAILISAAAAKGQDNMVINLAGEESVSTPVENIQRVTLESENMLLKTGDGENSYGFDAIESVTFEGETEGKTTEMAIRKNGEVVYQSGLEVSDSFELTKISVAAGEPVEINGITWAASNVDAPGTLAASPWDKGMLYKWNIAVGWSSADPMVNHEGGTTWDTSPAGGLVWEESNNVCPEGWHIATRDEFQSLVSSGYVAVELNGVSGYIFGSGTNRVFFPLAGFRRNDEGNWGTLMTEQGRYWSSTTTDDLNGVTSYLLGLYPNAVEIGSYLNGNAMSIRCVLSE